MSTLLATGLAQALKAAPADGNTLFLSHDHTITILPLVVKKPGYDPARDFVPVAGFATFAELGLAGFEDLPYYGIFAPKGTPQATIDKLGNAVAKVIALPDVRERLTGMGLSVVYMTAAQLASREQAYAKTWTRIIHDSGFKAQ